VIAACVEALVLAAAAEVVVDFETWAAACAAVDCFEFSAAPRPTLACAAAWSLIDAADLAFDDAGHLREKTLEEREFEVYLASYHAGDES
jgi:hypothetical protein